MILELKVFTLPTCSVCPVAKTIALEVAEEFGIDYREVNMAVKDGLDEGVVFDILSTPSIAIDDEVIAKGRLVSKEKLVEEVKKRVERWRERASKEEALVP